MSLFGKIMLVVAVLWTIVAFGLMQRSDSVYDFMRVHFVTVFVGFIIIIVVTIVAKKIVSTM